MTVLTPAWTGDNKFPAYRDRMVVGSTGIQAGAVGGLAGEVTAGSGLQVFIYPGIFWVKQNNGKSFSLPGEENILYNVPIETALNPYNSVEVSSANPQIAQIILRVYDVEELGISGSSYGRLEWLNGIPNSNATKAKMQEGIFEGAASLPESSLRLSSILIPKNATSSSEFYIMDRRPWAKGAFAIATRSVLTTKETSSTSYSSIDSNIRRRIECSGNPIELTCYGNYSCAETTGTPNFCFFQDGIRSGSEWFPAPRVVSSQFYMSQIIVPKVGTHLFEPAFAAGVGSGAVKISYSSTNPLTFVIEEKMWGSSINGRE
jgi:hypothetical protein